MKKKIQTKTNLIKYLNPSRITNDKRTNLSNAHCRSMQELDLNQMPNKLNQNNIHHSSVFNQSTDMNQTQSVKSKSLTKFMALFQNSNLLNQENTKTNSKKKVYNGFTYDLKIGTHKKRQQCNNQNRPKPQNKSTLVLKKQKYQNQATQNSLDLMTKMKNLIQQLKQKQKHQATSIQALQRQNLQLSQQFMCLQQKVVNLQNNEKKLTQKINHLLKQNSILKNKQPQKIKCKEHHLVIQSLKKVINQQLNKIIQYERRQLQYQIQKQQYEQEMNSSISSKYKLSEQLQLQLQRPNHNSQSPNKFYGENLKQKHHYDNKKQNRKNHQKNSIFQQLQSPGHNSLIKIRQDENYQSGNSAIQSITEQTQENDSEYIQTGKKQSLHRKDKILDEVDEYLANFRKR